MLLLAHRAGDWLAVPGAVWALGAATTAVACCLAAPHRRGLPLTAGRTWGRWTGAAISAAVALAAVLLVT